MQGIDYVQVGAFRIRCIRETLNEKFVGGDCIVSSFQAAVACGKGTKSVAGTFTLGKLLEDFLKILDGLFVFSLQIQTASELVKGVGYSTALRIMFNQRLVVHTSAGKVAIKLVDGSS